MKSAIKIILQDWMKAPETLAVMNVLNGNSAEPMALFVGGCVRNTLLTVAVEDIDIATKQEPGEIIRLLSAANIKTIPTGIDHGTVTAVIDGKSFEITTLRKDVATDGRRAVVEFSEDWIEDAQRRDFTINTLLMDVAGHVYDPLGSGLADIKTRSIVFVGDPAQRIAEDYLRILRFFRFHAWYGVGDMDVATLKACASAADKISTLSKERITQEFFKLLQAPAPLTALTAMKEAGVLKSFWNENTLDYVQRLLQTEGGDVDFVARIWLFCGDGLCDEILLFSNTLKKKLKSISDVLASSALRTEHEVKEAVYRYGRDAVLSALKVLVARGEGDEETLPSLLALAFQWKIPVFAVSGEDLIAQGHEQGPTLGAKLKTLEQEWIDNGFC